MDRQIRVTEPDKLQADIEFRYTAANKGMAIITPYYVYDVQEEDGSVTWNFSKSSMEDEVEFSHPPLKTIEDVNAFDQSFTAKHFKHNKDFTASKSSITLIDNPYPARFIVHNFDKPVGILDITGHYPETEKSLNYISTLRLRDDGSLKGTAFESNAALLKRFKGEYLEQEWMFGEAGSRIEFVGLGW